MSGIEIVGIVLAVIPIAIAAIEKYRSPYFGQRFGSFRKKDVFVQRLLRILDAQKFLLKTDIQITLDNAGVDYDRFSDHINPALFQDTTVADAVHNYLGKDADVYYGAVERCRIILAEVVGKIQGLAPVPSDLAALVRAYPQTAGRYQLPERIKFPVSKHELESQITELNEATTTLQRVSDGMFRVRERVILRSSSAQSTAFMSALNKVRTHARKLYLAISAAYSSRCHAQHEARLFLSSHAHILERPNTSRDRKPLSFTVLFSPEISLSGASPSYRTDIKIADATNSSPAAPAALGRVKFSPPTPPITPERQRSTVHDLCQAIQMARDGGIILELMLSEDKCLTHCYISSSVSTDSIHGIASIDGFVTLQDLLNDKLQPAWLQGPKMVLSSIVASSTMQLVTTPWLRLPLTSRSVRFSQHEVEQALRHPRAVPEPFVEEFFTHTKPLPPLPKGCSVREYMLELGILLLEIDRWKTLDDYQTERATNGQPTLLSRYDLARNWAETTELDRLQPHQCAIERCIECTFATSGAIMDWEDGVLRKSIAELVLRPLQENCPVILL
ncbi:hypothetical protein BJX64DRAFT_289831 [Aspergillus heterothallicus]